MEQKKTFATYQVSLKILVKKDNKYLFLLTPKGQVYDLPGGRIDKDEDYLPFEKIIEREVKEELGTSFKYKLGNPLFQCRRHFEEKNRHVFLNVYEAEHLSGEINLSNEHGDYKWIETDKIKKGQFFCEEEYRAFKNYFKKNEKK